MFNLENSGINEMLVEENSINVDLEVLVICLFEWVRMVFVFYVIEGYRYEDIVSMLNMVVGLSKV